MIELLVILLFNIKSNLKFLLLVSIFRITWNNFEYEYEYVYFISFNIDVSAYGSKVSSL